MQSADEITRACSALSSPGLFRLATAVAIGVGLVALYGHRLPQGKWWGRLFIALGVVGVFAFVWLFWLFAYAAEGLR